uniref:Secreted protein n=2 Tax=Panagrellus redivivus TaxID=6233 RepID=A0A7E4VRE3_PANRE
MSIHWLGLQLLLSLSIATASKVFPVNSKAPTGWFVADLAYDGICTQHETLTVQSSLNSNYFAIENHTVVTRQPLERIAGQQVLLSILAVRAPFDRILTLTVDVQDEKKSPNFHIDVYETSIDSATPPTTELFFPQRVALIDNPSNEIYFGPVSDNNIVTFVNSKEYGRGSFTRLFLSRHALPNERQKVVWIGAHDRKQNRRIAVAKVVINITNVKIPPPQFELSVYEFDQKSVQSQATLLRITAKTARGAPVYRLEPESSQFDISPFTGDIFATRPLNSGRYELIVIAIDSLGQESAAKVKINLGSSQKFRRNRALAIAKRDRASDVALVLRENHPKGILKQSVLLFADERVDPAPVKSEFLTIHANGSIELTKPLNYESVNEARVIVPISGEKNRKYMMDGHGHRKLDVGLLTDYFEALTSCAGMAWHESLTDLDGSAATGHGHVLESAKRSQSIHLEVVDVDEAPRFLNSPLPFLAVVPYEKPVGYQVYQFFARDEAGDGDSAVEYRLINSEPSDAFIVDKRTGAVRTAQHRYTPGSTYKLYVQAKDATPTDNTTLQQSEVAVLEVYAGDRPPQFLNPSYSRTLREDTTVGNSLLLIETHSFRPIDDRRSKSQRKYRLIIDPTGEESPYFSIDERTGLVTLIRKLDYDDPSIPKVFKLKAVVSEDNKESTAPVEFIVEDVNDNVPNFVQPLYTATTKENVPMGRTILQVRAFDKDAGENGRIVYTVDHDDFQVNDEGEISARRRLDADQKRERFFIYRFNVTAEDRGMPRRRAVASVHVRTENTNDEPPVFVPTREYSAAVAEDAQGGTPVLQIQAIDPDRDQVSYGFLDENGFESTSSEFFEIDKDTGLMRLRDGVIPTDLLKFGSPYNLTIVAKDDGSCCDEASASTIHSATAIVRIGIADVNNNKPEFPECNTYSQLAKLQEGQYRHGDAPVILKVRAVDEDASTNGEIVYSLYYGRSESRKPFVIDAVTGELRPSPHFTFDREAKAFEDVTVKATDRGERPLIGFCQFTVQILDVNDNAPEFERTLYETSISRDTQPGASVLTVLADDRDSAPNARISYKLEPDETSGPEAFGDADFFTFSPTSSGEITLAQHVPPGRKRFVFNVVANDNGKPEPQQSVVQVVVNVHAHAQNAPIWQTSRGCKQSVAVDEDIPVYTELFRCHATSTGAGKSQISYKMSNGVKLGTNYKQKFREFQIKEHGTDWVVIRTMEPLDFEETSNYTLTVAATDVRSQVSTNKQFTVIVKDKNDNVPRFTVDRFTGTIDEELLPAEYMDRFQSKPITTVKAEDADAPGAQSEIRYAIVQDSASTAWKHFRVDEITGGIYPLDKFDREAQDSFIFDVEAMDGMPSSLPGATGNNKDIVKVQIFIADVNDNPPYFTEKKYEGKVSEDAEIDTGVLTVKASDLDRHSQLRYDLANPDGGKIPFGVKTDTGVVFVKEPLDFEQQNVYHLLLTVTDGKHNTTTNVYLYVLDVNDNAPVFEAPLYSATLDEGAQTVPKRLFTVKATDADADASSQQIVYKLEGQGVGDYFTVDPVAGHIEVVKPLDRDPPNGVPAWKFIVQAIDANGEGLTGYADVHVILRDINDNAPIFPTEMHGTVDENRDPGDDGIYVMTAAATDYDDPATLNAQLEYSISVNKEIDGEPVFRIDKANGKLFVMRRLDRETPSERLFTIEVRATDKGSPPLEGVGNVTIRVADVNDNQPSFEKAQYDAVASELLVPGEAVISVAAVDKDAEARDNVFTYELIDESNDHFYMTTEPGSNGANIGILRIKKTPSFVLAAACKANGTKTFWKCFRSESRTDQYSWEHMCLDLGQNGVKRAFPPPYCFALVRRL